MIIKYFIDIYIYLQIEYITLIYVRVIIGKISCDIF